MEKSILVEEDEIICNCFQVTESEIRSYIAENEVIEIEEVTSGCEAGGNCQTCHILIQLFIDQHQQNHDPVEILELVSAERQENNKGFLGRLFTNA